MPQTSPIPLRMRRGAHELAWSRGRGPTREEVKQFLPELKKAEIETGWGPVSRAEFAAGRASARLVRQIERYFPTTIGVWPLSHWLRPTSQSVRGVVERRRDQLRNKSGHELYPGRA